MKTPLGNDVIELLVILVEVWIVLFIVGWAIKLLNEKVVNPK